MESADISAREQASARSASAFVWPRGGLGGRADEGAYVMSLHAECWFTKRPKVLPNNNQGREGLRGNLPLLSIWGGR